MSTPRKWLVSLAIAVAASVASSCGSLTTAPITTNQATTNSATTATQQGAAQSSSLIGLVDNLVGDTVQLLYKIVNIVGSVGGSLTNGRWRIDVPPNAISGTATVRLGVANSLSSSCQLDITPVTANHFAVPVRLTVDCSAVPLDQLSTYIIYWYDPSTSRWVPVEGSTVDLKAKTVSAPLQHFSQYAVGGKANW